MFLDLRFFVFSYSTNVIIPSPNKKVHQTVDIKTVNKHDSTSLKFWLKNHRDRYHEFVCQNWVYTTIISIDTDLYSKLGGVMISRFPVRQMITKYF